MGSNNVIKLLDGSCPVASVSSSYVKMLLFFLAHGPILVLLETLSTQSPYIMEVSYIFTKIILA